ncbi:uncharacterized protein LOC124110496 [Haliotis rufescens]|uniref:uncharacterized protein LOC124110496 n=1 Tax=Haliotis rufescens TaxID=6454 RepID=UPI001EAFBDF5|nr:uncharacterized protein LOC124110496 [Haliotis rufescens]
MALRLVEYVTSARGTQRVIFEGYLFNKNATRQTAQHWRCVIKSCSGKCTTVGDFVRNVSEHNRPSENSNRVRFVSNMRKRAREETTPIQQLYNQQIAEEDDDQAQALPAFPSMSSALYRHRRKTMPVLP